jgi:hypothetical protein
LQDGGKRKMSDISGVMALVATLSAPVEVPEAQSFNWCTPGYTVMIPDGREGVVTSTDGDICRVVTDGEAYVTPIPHFIVEPVYPQKFAARAYR